MPPFQPKPSMEKLRGGTAKGIMLGLAGALVISPDAYLIKVAELSPLATLFWRAIFTGLATLTYVMIWKRGRVISFYKSLGRQGLFLGGIYGIGTLLFVLSITNTSAANALVTISINPLITAVFAHFWLGEKLNKSTIAALGFALCGIVIFFFDGLQSENLLGVLFAIPCAIILAFEFVYLRRYRHLKLFPCTLYGAVLLTVSIGLMADVSAEPWQIGVMAINGGLSSALAFALIFSAVKYVPAVFISLMMLIETVLGPYIVWLLLDEEISAYTLAGSALIISTLLIYFLSRLKFKPRSFRSAAKKAKS